jgi:hypothetical protein
MDNLWRYNRLDRQSNKRKHVTDREPQPSRVNILDASRTKTRLRQHRHQIAPPMLPSLPNRHAESVGKSTTPYNKLPVTNPRLQDLTLATEQLCNNPYAHSLWTS